MEERIAKLEADLLIAEEALDASLAVQTGLRRDVDLVADVLQVALRRIQALEAD